MAESAPKSKNRRARRQCESFLPCCSRKSARDDALLHPAFRLRVETTLRVSARVLHRSPYLRASHSRLCLSRDSPDRVHLGWLEARCTDGKRMDHGRSYRYCGHITSSLHPARLSPGMVYERI